MHFSVALEIVCISEVIALTNSPMIRFRTGAAIYDIKNEIVVGVGCSHNQLGSQVSSLTTHTSSSRLNS